MEELVDQVDLVDGFLVKAVMALIPGESIERVLDETRNILIQRGLNYVKKEFAEDVEIIADDLKDMGYSPDNINTILSLFFNKAVNFTGSTRHRRCLCFRWKR